MSQFHGKYSRIDRSFPILNSIQITIGRHFRWEIFQDINFPPSSIQFPISFVENYKACPTLSQFRDELRHWHAIEDSPGNLRLIIQGYANKARGLARVYVEIADTKAHDDSVNSPPREDVARSRQDTAAYGRD